MVSSHSAFKNQGTGNKKKSNKKKSTNREFSISRQNLNSKNVNSNFETFSEHQTRVSVVHNNTAVISPLNLTPRFQLYTSFKGWFSDKFNYMEKGRVIPQRVYIEFYKHNLDCAHENDLKDLEFKKMILKDRKKFNKKWSEYHLAVETINFALLKEHKRGFMERNLSYPKYPQAQTQEAASWESLYMRTIPLILFRLKQEKDPNNPNKHNLPTSFDPEKDSLPTIADLNKYHPHKKQVLADQKNQKK